MKTIAIILAGGVGKRMGGTIPKQFLNLNDKPIIAYTIDNFQRCDVVDGVLVVCVKDWIPELRRIVNEFQLSKVQWVVEGGDTSHDSTRNGVFALRHVLEKDDFVIIHDAARPILPQQAILEMMSVAKKYGNASLAIPCHETLIYTDDQASGTSQLDRSKIMRIQTPQTYQYGSILKLYEQADADNLHDFIYADLVAVHYGMRVYFSKGFTNNIKITKGEDLSLCKALMQFSEKELYSL